MRVRIKSPGNTRPSAVSVFASFHVLSGGADYDILKIAEAAADEWSKFLAVKELLGLSVRVSPSPRHGSRYAQIDRICIQDGDDATALSSTPNGG